MKNSLYPCWILRGRAAEAAQFYRGVFKEFQMLHDTPLVKEMAIFGQKIMLLNEGPETQPDPSISFMLICEHESEARFYWEQLSAGGTVLMPLGAYDWSPEYGWLSDRFGISWQIYTGSLKDTPQRINPVLMFTGSDAGKAEEAIHFYSGIFREASIQGILKYAETEDNPGSVKHAQFRLRDYIVMAMDSSMEHGFSFNDAVSFVVPCKDQPEIDYLWEKLQQGGGTELGCGWLVDRFGVRWQIIPENMTDLILDPEQGQSAFQAMLKMKKIIIADLN